MKIKYLFKCLLIDESCTNVSCCHILLISKGLILSPSIVYYNAFKELSLVFLTWGDIIGILVPCIRSGFNNSGTLPPVAVAALWVAGLLGLWTGVANGDCAGEVWGLIAGLTAGLTCSFMGSGDWIGDERSDDTKSRKKNWIAKKTKHNVPWKVLNLSDR